MSNAAILDALYDVIEDRKVNPPEKSYVVSLLNAGSAKIGAKVTEEAAELVEAAAAEDDEHTVREAADLLFHTLVLLGHKGIAPRRVYQELARRFGISGIVEKENRDR